MILLKSEQDLEIMRRAGKILAQIVRQLREKVSAGVTTGEIDNLAAQLCFEAKVVPAFKGYKGFPAYTCISINEEVVHGIPGARVINDGDLVSIDFGIEHCGFFSDTAVTVPVGKVNSGAKKLIEVTKQAMLEGIKQARPLNYLGDISNAVQSYAERYGYSVVRQFVGHGIGRNLHEEPEIPNYGRPHQGPALKKGMVLAIEPMVNMGTWECEIEDNGWTAVTKDGRLSAHFEHTVAVTDKGPEILTH